MDSTIRFPKGEARLVSRIARRGTPGKYDSLRRFLEGAAPHLSNMTLSFRQIEQILSGALPPSARKHRPWWANPSSASDHPHAQAWLAAGWKVDAVDQQGESVRFRRLG